MKCSTRALALIALCGLALSACAQGGSSSTTAASGGPAPGKTMKASAITVGYAGPTLTNAFFVGLEKGSRTARRSRASNSRRPTRTGTRSSSSTMPSTCSIRASMYSSSRRSTVTESLRLFSRPTPREYRSLRSTAVRPAAR